MFVRKLFILPHFTLLSHNLIAILIATSIPVDPSSTVQQYKNKNENKNENENENKNEDENKNENKNTNEGIFSIENIPEKQ